MNQRRWPNGARWNCWLKKRIIHRQHQPTKVNKQFVLFHLYAGLDFRFFFHISEDTIFSHTFLQRVASERGGARRATLGTSASVDKGGHDSPPGSPGLPTCPTTVLVLVFHAGSCLDANTDRIAQKSDVTTFRGAFESVMRQHYPSLVGHVAIKLVCCPSVCTDALGILSR